MENKGPRRLNGDIPVSSNFAKCQTYLSFRFGLIIYIEKIATAIRTGNSHNKTLQEVVDMIETSLWLS